MDKFSDIKTKDMVLQVINATFEKQSNGNLKLGCDVRLFSIFSRWQIEQDKFGLNLKPPLEKLERMVNDKKSEIYHKEALFSYVDLG